jgi:hypothetical protein
MLLVQAVSQFRQRRPGDAVTSMLNLISAYRAQPDEGSSSSSGSSGGAVGVVQWGEREELKDLYNTFTTKVRCVCVCVFLGLCVRLMCVA